MWPFFSLHCNHLIWKALSCFWEPEFIYTLCRQLLFYHLHLSISNQPWWQMVAGCKEQVLFSPGQSVGSYKWVHSIYQLQCTNAVRFSSLCMYPYLPRITNPLTILTRQGVWSDFFFLFLLFFIKKKKKNRMSINQPFLWENQFLMIWTEQMFLSPYILLSKGIINSMAGLNGMELVPKNKPPLSFQVSLVGWWLTSLNVETIKSIISYHRELTTDEAENGLTQSCVPSLFYCFQRPQTRNVEMTMQ